MLFRSFGLLISVFQEVGIKDTTNEDENDLVAKKAYFLLITQHTVQSERQIRNYFRNTLA